MPLPDVPHRSGGDRYAVYRVTKRYRRKDDPAGTPLVVEQRERLAETSLAGIGGTLVTLSEEGEYGEGDRVGIFDRKLRIWIVSPWAGTSPWIPTD